jgi:hypothetical protein
MRPSAGKPVIWVKRQNAGVVGEYWHGVGKAANLMYVSVVSALVAYSHSGRITKGATVAPAKHTPRSGWAPLQVRQF